MTFEVDIPTSMKLVRMEIVLDERTDEKGTIHVRRIRKTYKRHDIKKGKVEVRKDEV